MAPSSPPADESLPEATMGFWDHVEALRRHLLLAVAGVLVCFIVAMCFQDELMAFVMHPYLIGVERARADLVDRFGAGFDAAAVLRADIYVTSPVERFFQYMKVALVASLLVSLPWSLWCVWSFIRAGLYPAERRVVERAIPFSMFLALCGLALGYLVMVPVVLQQLLIYGQPPPDAGFSVVNLVTLDKYLGFFLILTLVQALAFQLPIVMQALAAAGVATAGGFARKRRHAIIALAVFAMLATPPDVFSMVTVLVPLLVLYELGIGLAALAERRRARRAADDRARYGDGDLADALLDPPDGPPAEAPTAGTEGGSGLLGTVPAAREAGAESWENPPAPPPAVLPAPHRSPRRSAETPGTPSPAALPPAVPSPRGPDAHPDDEIPLDFEQVYGPGGAAGAPQEVPSDEFRVPSSEGGGARRAAPPLSPATPPLPLKGGGGEAIPETSHLKPETSDLTPVDEDYLRALGIEPAPGARGPADLYDHEGHPLDWADPRVAAGLRAALGLPADETDLTLLLRRLVREELARHARPRPPEQP